jgi:hypothetical protein
MWQQLGAPPGHGDDVPTTRGRARERLGRAWRRVRSVCELLDVLNAAGRGQGCVEARWGAAALHGGHTHPTSNTWQARFSSTLGPQFGIFG